MKINIFRTIWAKLLFYYILLIISTVTIFFYLSSSDFQKIHEAGMKKEIVNSISLIAKLLVANHSEGSNITDLKKDFLELSSLSRMRIQLLDTEGNEVVQSKFRHPRPPDRNRGDEFNGIMLTRDELDLILKGHEVANERKDSGFKERVFYAACPVIIKGRIKGFLFTLMPLSPPRHIRSFLVKSLAVAIISACIIAYFLSKNFTKPIIEMEKAARQIAKGNFSYKMKIDRKDELGYLANTFNEMSLRLKKNIESRMKMMGDISHELNTPLTNIQAGTEAMFDGIIESPAEQKKYLSSILRQTKRLSYLINDITELSKFEAGEVKINKQPFYITDPVNRAIECSSFLISQKEAKVTVNIEDESLQACGDSERILQAIQNLLNNALQHNRRGTEVKISIKQDKKKVLFSIEDNGKGIPPGEIDSIFERFHKVDKARTTGESGSGLGLAIVKEIIEAHGEIINIASSDKGSRFFFSLPAINHDS